MAPLLQSRAVACLAWSDRLFGIWHVQALQLKMNIYRVILLALLTTVIVAIVATEDNHSKEKSIDFALSDEQGTSRLMLFRLLPQYSDVDFGANFNKLKSSGDTAYFVVRDTIVVTSLCCQAQPQLANLA